MADKKVEVEVVTDVELTEVQALENKINELQRQRLAVNIEANTQKLNELQDKIDGIDTVIETSVDLSDEELEELKSELADLESKKLDLQLDIEKDKLEDTKLEIEDLDDTEIDLQVNNISAMEAIDQIGQGFDRLKQGASGVGQQLGSVLESAGRMEQTEAFLSMNLGADKAKQKLEEIREVTDSLPGDDSALQNLLSQAVIQDANMTADAFSQMGIAAADYMAAMENFGKTSKETQQDLMNYILAGNTAELEGSPILQDKIDKLKEGTTVQERSKLLAEAINEAHWGGISQQDTYNNKLQKFTDMLERGKMKLGGMFQEGAKGAMDFLLKLDDSTQGLVGMTIAVSSFASPLTDSIMGLGQMATGFKAIKDLGIIKWLKDLELAQKASAAAQWLLNASFWSNPITIIVLAIIALIAVLGYLYFNNEQVREAIDGLGQTLQWVAGVIWDSLVGAFEWLSSVFQNFTSQIGLNTSDWKQAVLGFILFLPQLPLRVGQLLVDTIARALGFGDDFTQTMIDSATNAVNGFLEQIYALPGTIMTVLQGIWDYVLTLGGLLPQQTQLTGNQIVNSILQVLGFISQLPAAIAMYFVNIIASTLGFGNNFTQNMISAGVNAVNGFVNWITSLPGKLKAELDKMLEMASNFAMEIADKLTFGGASMVAGWLSGSGEHSPGFMYDALINELMAMINAPEMLRDLVNGMGDKGYEMANALSMALFGVDIDTAIMSWITTLQGFQDYMLTLGGLLPLNVELTGNQIIDTLLRVVGFFGTLPLQIGMFLTDMIAQAFGFQGSFTDALINAGLNGVNGFISWITSLPGRLWAILLQTLQGVYNFGSNFISGLASRAMAAVSGFANAVQGIPRAIQQCLDWAYNILMSHPIVQAAIWLGNAIANGLSAVGLGQKSPGKIVKAIRQELKWSQEEMESSDLPKVSEVLGANIASNFNPNLGTSNVLIAGSGRSHGDTIINVYGDVDSDNRVKQIVEAVRMELEFDNKTAGRTV